MRGRWGRRGQILFLEFMATLPIFALLFIAMTAFHYYYLRTGQEHGKARMGAWTGSQNVISLRQPSAKLYSSRIKDEDDALEDVATLNVPYGVRTAKAVSTQVSGAPGWMGMGEAVGRVEVNQDPWAYEEIQWKADPQPRPGWLRKGADDPAGTMRPVQLYQFTLRKKSGKWDTPNKAAMKFQDGVFKDYEAMGAKSPLGRDFTVESTAFLMYGGQFSGKQQAFLGL